MLFCVLLMEPFDVFQTSLLLFGMFNMVSVKIFPSFYDHIKLKIDNNPILPQQTTKPWKMFNPKKSKGLLTFWEVKNSGCFTHF